MKPFLSIKETAAYLGVEYKTIWRLVRKGDLPGAKIGGVYRIRREDIDELFEKQVRRPQVGTTADAVPLGPCAFCGKSIASELDVGGHCEICGVDLCVTCWLLEGRHHCSEHASTGRQHEAPSGDDMVPLRCSRCFRVLPSGAAACTCQEPGCDRPLCADCCSRPGERFCRGHTPTLQDKLAKARQDLAAGVISVLVTSVEARRAEVSFIGRFDQKVRAITTIRNPLNGSVHRMRSWDEAHESGDQVSDLLAILNIAFLDKDLARVLPMNLWSRYTAPDVGVRPGRGLVLEARCISHLKASATDGFDTAPAGLEELLPTLEAQARRAEELGRPHILGLASTTGWAREATKYLGGDPTGQSYSHGFLLPYLIDLLTGEVTYNALDERLLALVSLFSLALEGEEVQRVTSYIDRYLMTHHGLPVAEIAKEVGVAEQTVAKALSRLHESGTHRVETIEGIGRVVVRRNELTSPE